MRPQSSGEELANSLSHGAGLLVAVPGAAILVDAALPHRAVNIVGAAVFATTLLLLYLASTLYHALPAGRGKSALLKLDHGAIFLFIAGSYTPFALTGPAGVRDWTLLGVVWASALAGFTLKALDRLSHAWLSTGLYLALGWLALVAAGPLLERVPPSGVALLMAGGVAYTVGVVFFVLDSRLRYAHAVWHGFVLAGSGCHFFAVLDYAA